MKATGAAPKRRRRRVSGAFRGLVVGVLGAVLWYVAATGMLGQGVWWRMWAQPEHMTNLELEVVFVFFLGPLTGLILSPVISGVAEEAIRDRRVSTAPAAGAVAAALYGVALGLPFLLSRTFVANTSELGARLGGWLFWTGVPFVGGAPLIAWALLAGLAHAVWRPRPDQAVSPGG